MRKLLASLLVLAGITCSALADALVVVGNTGSTTGTFDQAGSLLYRAVYFGFGKPELWIYDIADPGTAVLLSSTPIGDGTGGPIVADVAVSGSFVFMLSNSTVPGVPGRLHVVDASDPSAPVEVVDVAAALHGRTLDLVGSLLFTTDGSPGPPLHIIDVSMPTMPIEVATFAPPGISRFGGIDGDGTLAYLGTSPGVLTVDFANLPGPPVFQSYVPAHTDVLSRDGANHLLFAATAGESPGALDILDISDPSTPGLLSTLPLSSAPVFGGRAGDLAYFSNCVILDLADPSAPEIVNQCSFGRGDLFVQGGFGYFSDGSIMDFSLPELPRLLATVPSTQAADGVVIAGARAYVAEGTNGLRVVDIANPTAPHTLALVDTPGGARDVAVQGAFAYVADGPAGLRIIDVAAAMPALRGAFQTPTPAVGVEVQGTHAYVAAGTAGLAIFDVANPNAPIPIASVPSTNATELDVQGSRLLLADRAGGLRIIDIANPGAPIVLGSYPLPDARAVVRSGPLAYVADHVTGLVILDVSNGAAPHLVGTYPKFQLASVAVAGDIAEIGTHLRGITTLDVSDPASPRLLGGLEEGFCCLDVAIRGTLIFGAGLEGLQIQDYGPQYDPGAARCGVATDAASYADGDLVRLTSLHFANPRVAVQPTRLRLQLITPFGLTVNLLDAGAGGGLALPGSFDVDLAPVSLFSVPPSLPNGAYSVRCALEDPMTGTLQHESSANFDLL